MDAEQERRIARKMQDFIDRGVVPSAHLYRHYDVDGDLLYVGISTDPVGRLSAHFRSSDWRHKILKVLIEPFESQDKAAKAEELAIRTEAPKYNVVYSRCSLSGDEQFLRLFRSTQPPAESNGLMNLAATAEYTGLSALLIGELMEQGKFPLPVRQRMGCGAWVKSEVHAWVAAREAASQES